MACKYRRSQEEKRQVEGLCRFHKFELSMPEGPIPITHAENRSIGWLHLWAPEDEFLDAFQGYHQIALTAKDQEKTAFISPDANYHYTMMPFEL